MHALNSPFAPILATLQTMPACADACDLLIAYESSTLKQVIDALEDLGRLAYLAWFFYTFHPQLENAARFYLLRTLELHPMRLLFFYSDLTDLTNQELDFILDCVQTQTPAAWTQLQLGAIPCGTPGGGP